MFNTRGSRGRDNSDRHPKPVTKIEVSEKSPKLRLALAIIFGLVGVSALTYSLVHFLNKDPGWVTIEPEIKEATCADEFVFQYNIGASGISSSAEYKAILNYYTEATKLTYQVFHSTDSFAGVNNIRHINLNPNKELIVEPVLYDAFTKLEDANNRLIYLAPIYDQYYNIYSSNDDTLALEFDPQNNADIRQYFDEILEFANDPNQVKVELLGDNRVKLFVSEDYMKYASEMRIDSFIDFSWMKNAFIVDYIADTLTQKGLLYGSIASYDGFVRNLDSISGTEYTFNLFDRVGNTVSQKDSLVYTGEVSIVCLRDYRMNPLDKYHYYEFKDGRIYTPYIDITDGLCKASVHDMVCYSKTVKCADILLKTIPAYICENLDENAVNDMTLNNIICIY